MEGRSEERRGEGERKEGRSEKGRSDGRSVGGREEGREGERKKGRREMKEEAHLGAKAVEKNVMSVMRSTGSFVPLNAITITSLRSSCIIYWLVGKW